MLVKILLTVGVLLVMFLVATRPVICVSRSATIPAPPAVVFEQVNDLHKWEAWSPWAKLDPNAKQTVAGPGVGAGASVHWAGNRRSAANLSGGLRT